MELTFWNILKILLGVWLFIGMVRFLIASAGVFFANIFMGIWGGILGVIAALLLKAYLIPSLPAWYIIAPIGLLIGSIVNNIISQGLGTYIKINLSTLWESFIDAFFLVNSGGGSSSYQPSEKKDVYERTFNKDSGATCESCFYWNSSKFSCNYHGGYRSSTYSSCDSHKYR